MERKLTLRERALYWLAARIERQLDRISQRQWAKHGVAGPVRRVNDDDEGQLVETDRYPGAFERRS